MKWRIVLTLLVVPVLARSGTAGIFGKKPTPNPADRVPELLNVLKTDGDENKRVAAAEELRQYEATAYPQIVPALVETLQADKKPGVRVEAVQTLGRLRPISPAAGQALEQARDKDPSMRVRMQARHALLHYHWAGYHGSKPHEPPLQSKEPPQAEAKNGTPPVRTSPLPVNGTRPPKGQTAEPPLAPPVTTTRDRPAPRLVPTVPPPPPVTPTGGFRPMPTGPTRGIGQTAEPPLAPPLPLPLMPLPVSPDSRNQPTTAPGPAPDQTGPDLGPQE